MSTQYQRSNESDLRPATGGDLKPTRSIELEPQGADHEAVAADGGGARGRPGTAAPRSTAPRSTTLGFADEVVVPRKRHIIDRFDNAAGLFLLRLTVAAVMGVHGLQKVQDQARVVQQLRALRVPAPETAGMLFGPIEIAIAVALVLGLAVRAAGLGTAVVAVSALVLVRWTGAAQIFVADQAGFTGETELLLAGVGLMLLGVGGGGWGLDRKVRNRRAA